MLGARAAMVSCAAMLAALASACVLEDYTFGAGPGGQGGTATTTSTGGGGTGPSGGNGGTTSAGGSGADGGMAGAGGSGGQLEKPDLIEIGFGSSVAGSTVDATLTTGVPAGSFLVAVAVARANGPVEIGNVGGVPWIQLVEHVNATGQAVVAVFHVVLTSALDAGSVVTVDVDDQTDLTRELLVLWAPGATSVDALGTSQSTDPMVAVTTATEVTGARSWLIAATATGATASSVFSDHLPFEALHPFAEMGSSGAFFINTAVGLAGTAAEFTATATGPANIAAMLVVLR